MEGLLKEKKKKVSLTQESSEWSAAENVFWVNTALMLVLYHLVKAIVGKKQQARWTPSLDYGFIQLLSFLRDKTLFHTF